MAFKHWGKYLPAIGIGFGITAVLSWVFTSPSPYLKNLVEHINNVVADKMFIANLKHLPPIGKQHIAIVAIDDKSIKNEGRWPWSRQKTSALLNQLQSMGASVVAFDVIFSEPENNPVETLIKNIPNASTQELNWLKQEIPQFDYDQTFSNTIAKGDTLLGFSFHPTNPSTQGVLPQAIEVNDAHLYQTIPEMQGYIASTDKLSKATSLGGFLNAEPDSHGVLRQSQLVLSYQDKIYPSLSLAAVKAYLLVDSLRLVTEQYGDTALLSGIELDKNLIPTDETGKIWVPFREGAYAFPFYSATDILKHQIKDEDVAGRLIFVGVTATALGDLHPTPLAPSYPGVEVHASIASGIIDKYFPSRPIWSQGLEFILIILCGVTASLSFPFLNAFILMMVMLCSGLIWYFLTEYMWIKYALMLTMLFPLITILMIALMNMVNSYLLASRQKKEIKDAFGQYVPKQHIENILKSSSEQLLSGDSKEITVLFSDIRGFTTMSEKLSAVELKQQLNEYLTEMTQVIFNYGGTIDKYVGDMIMAFWNAPLADEEHAKKAVLSGLHMQKKLESLNQFFLQKGLPTIGIGVGINTTVCNIGDMGSKFRRAYTAIGDGVNLASRLEALCRRYNVGVIVGSNTYQKTKDDFIYLHLDKVKVKGKHLGENIYCPLIDKDKGDAKLEDLITAHHAALDAYYKQDWKAAKKQFKALEKTSPYVDLCQLFLERADYFEDNPPKKDWDGAFEMKEK